MKSHAVVFSLSGALFGLLVGWIVGSQRPDLRSAAAVPSTPVVTQARQAAGPITNPALPESVPLDTVRERELHAVADRDQTDVLSRIGLGDLYFDAGQFDRAIGWYETALTLDPGNVNVSTDLGVSYYYTGQVDRALVQFQRSLETDPNHTKTLLNVGIVRAYGARDLNGAAAAWRKLIEIAPDTAEGRAAQAALERIAAPHAG